jgi:hypothetical protein
MLINLSIHLQVEVINTLSIPKHFFLIHNFYNNTNYVNCLQWEYNKRIAVKTIQRNWRLYKKLKKRRFLKGLKFNHPIREIMWLARINSNLT